MALRKGHEKRKGKVVRRSYSVNTINKEFRSVFDLQIRFSENSFSLRA
ncbi:unnamed protein product, partial [Vitis vinifera]|uniref:Uncharacterized protein n=1 Tax=Vitis vinifera TaxID=29760 RepID=E0CT79_VITVI